MNNSEDPINTVKDFYDLMSSDFLNESFESGAPVNLSGSDKENNSASLVVADDIDCVPSVTHTRTLRSSRKANVQKPRNLRSRKVKAKGAEQLVISVNSDDEDSSLYGLNNETSRNSKYLATSNDVISLIDDDIDSSIISPTYNTLDYAFQAELLNEELRVKISWVLEGNMVYNLRRFQPFKFIYKKIAEERNINIKYILLTKNDYKIKHYDTPDSIDLSVIDILVGDKFSLPVTFTDDTINSVKNKNSLSLTVITESKRNNKKVFTIQKEHCMFILFVKIAEHLECDAKDISLWFDGEKVDPAKTPVDLDIDDGECLELKCHTKENFTWNL